MQHHVLCETQLGNSAAYGRKCDCEEVKRLGLTEEQARNLAAHITRRTPSEATR